MIRLFAGLALPAALADRLARLGGGVPGARWVAARNLHVTLRFFGEIDEVQAEDLHHALCGLHAPVLDLRLNGFGTFGDSKPRALWAAVTPDPTLTQLQKRLEQMARSCGLAPETRTFVPHVTLAWLSRPPPDKVAAFLAHHSPLSAEMKITELTLFRSHLGGAGAEYETLTTYPLGV